MGQLGGGKTIHTMRRMSGGARKKKGGLHSPTESSADGRKEKEKETASSSQEGDICPALKVRRKKQEHQREWRAKDTRGKKNSIFFSRAKVRDKKNRFRRTSMETMTVSARVLLKGASENITINGSISSFH